MKNILTIFGGTGFVGGSIYDAFNQGLLEPFEIVELNLVSRGLTKKFLFDKHVKYFQYDFLTAKGELPKKTNLIIVAFDLADYNSYKNNLYNKTVFSNLKKVIENKYADAKILYLSSGAVYGKPYTNKKRVNEKFADFNYKDFDQHKLNYSLNKKFFEENLSILAQKTYSISIARCFTFIGPRIPLTKHFAIGNFFLNLLNNMPIKLISSKKVVRSYMDAKDLVIWLMKILEATNLKLKIFNVGSEIPISLVSLAKKFKKLFNCEIHYPKKILNNEIDFYVPNCKKIISTLNVNYEKNIDKLILNNYKIIKKNFFNL